MPPAPPLASDLEQELQRLFPRDDIPAASALLLSYGEHSYEREVNRVRWGILTVAGKDLAKLERMVVLAKRDYRDLLMAAEYTPLQNHEPRR